MEIIFMRHGKAEDPASRPSDFERELTAEGRQKVKAAARGLARCLLGTQHLRIWSSPLPRARQTAELVAEALGDVTVDLNELIPAGDFSGLVRAWSALHEDAQLLIVGHEPHLSHWVARMAGVVLPIKPAAVAGLEVRADTFQEGKLRWFAHPDVLARLGG